ncbi:MAG: metal-dependent transcriptional regulator [Deltaproteobacteria bacterium]|nr:metal-dependent transcriptional regulator [Deltaproteobacteria bacterium]
MSPALENYLCVIYILEREEGGPLIAATVAERVGVTAATMTETLRRLVQEGCVALDKRKRISLTPKGREIAESVMRRHGLVERLLTDVLGLDWSKVHEEAHRLEHVISPEVEERLARFLKYPATCPHGNPIPGRQRTTLRKSLPLHQVGAGQEVLLERITEDAEQDSRLLQHLDESGLRPGRRFRVAEVAPWLGTITLDTGAQRLSLGIAAARKIWVSPIGSASAGRRGQRA